MGRKTLRQQQAGCVVGSVRRVVRGSSLRGDRVWGERPEGLESDLRGPE